MSSSAVLEQFRSIGRDLFLAGVISSHGGNLSVRQGDRILITRRGSMLAQLEERDIIETGLEENDANVMLASTEIGVPKMVDRFATLGKSGLLINMQNLNAVLDLSLIHI